MYYTSTAVGTQILCGSKISINSPVDRFLQGSQISYKSTQMYFLKNPLYIRFFYIPSSRFLFTRVADPIELLFQTFSELLSPFFSFYKTAQLIKFLVNFKEEYLAIFGAPNLLNDDHNSKTSV